MVAVSSYGDALLVSRSLSGRRNLQLLPDDNAKGDGLVELVDAQIHVWGADRTDRPWPEDGAAYSHGAELTPESVIQEMDRVGVHRAVLVPPSFEGDRNDVALAAVRAYPERFRTMFRFPIEDPRAESALPGLQADPATLGARLVFAFRSANWLQDGTSDWYWPVAEELGINTMVFAPDQYELLGTIAARHPDLKLSICHVGLAEETRNEGIGPHLDRALKLARYPNIAIKATSLPTYVDEEYPFPTLRGMIQRLVDEFGPERVFWGSDLSRLSCSYAELKDFFTDELDFLNDEDLKLVMGGGLRKWFGWDVDAAGSGTRASI